MVNIYSQIQDIIWDYIQGYIVEICSIILTVFKTMFQQLLNINLVHNKPAIPANLGIQSVCF